MDRTGIKLLTLEQLDKRTGKRVWIEFAESSKLDGWWIVKDDWDYTWYRATWIAYDYPPKRNLVE